MRIFKLATLLLFSIFYLTSFSNAIEIDKNNLTGENILSHIEKIDNNEIQSKKIKGVALICIGLLGMFIPKKYLLFGERWKFKKQIEPSEGYILLSRVMGFLLVVFGILIVILYKG